MEATPLVNPNRLWSAQEVLVRPSPLPAAAGVYGWHFKQPPRPDLDAGCLLYIGIARGTWQTGPVLRTCASGCAITTGATR